MGSPLLAGLWIGTTANVIAGTWVLDSQGMGSAAMQVTTTALGSADVKDLYKWDVLGQHPLVYGPNEGWVLRNIQVYPTSLVMTGYLTFEWAELAVF